MPKEKKFNPVLKHARKEKLEAKKKHKSERLQRKSVYAARRNVSELAKQIHELQQLESQGKLSVHDRNLLQHLRSESNKLRLPSGRMAPQIDSDAQRQRKLDEDDMGPYIPIHPERSIYYDPVYNPLGVAPPGMPYEEVSDSSDSGWSTSSSVRKIPLPPGLLPPLKTDWIVDNMPAVSAEETVVNAEETVVNAEESVPNIERYEGPAQTTYTAAPVMRNLTREAAKMIPLSVSRARKRQETANDNISSAQPPPAVSSPIQHQMPEILTEPEQVSKPSRTRKRVNAAPDI